ncbi:adenosine deaminase [Pedococcus sp. P5_B7]
MSEQPGTESFEDDLGSISIDDATDSGSGQDDLLDASEGDNEPWSPPDLQPRNTEWGTTAWEQGQEETIEQRIRQEEPDPDSAYGAPDDEGGLDSGDADGDGFESAASDDDEPDSSTEIVDDGEVGGAEAGAGSPESAAMHVVED